MTTITDKLQQFFANGEQFVLNAILNIQQGEQVLEHELSAAFAWLNSHVAEVSADIEKTAAATQSVVTTLTTFGVAIPPQVAEAIKDANVAVTALNAYAAANSAGVGTPQSLVQVYAAAKTALSATAAAAAAAAFPVADPVIKPAS